MIRRAPPPKRVAPHWPRACALALLLLLSAGALAQTAAEYAAKAAFIYNVALFSDFPNMRGGRIRLCVFGRDPFGDVLAKLDGTSLGKASIAIAYPRSVSEAASQCEIVFISASEADKLGLLADTGKAAGVMTIADTKGAARMGVMLELSVEDQRIAFEFNGETARIANIVLSSKVLRLARAVY